MSQPYPTLSSILAHVRTEVNDAIVTLGGQTLTNTAAFTPYYVNRGWQMLQQYLLSLGYVRFRVPNLQLMLPPVASEDTALQVFINYYGYYDGVNVDATVLLPMDLIKPLSISERPTDLAPNTNSFVDMDGPDQGITDIPNTPKEQWNQCWVWNDDAIWMRGATVSTDIVIDYAAFLPDFTGSGDSFPGDQTANIMRCTSALAWFIGYVFCFARGDADAPTILENAQNEAAIIVDAKIPQRAK